MKKELIKNDKLYKKIYDNIHGQIEIEYEIINELIYTKEFQRLSRIKQLGFTYILFPGATHTRYSHSLGTYELAKRFLEQINKNEEIVDLKKTIMILIVALLHDLGHGPFSHSFEKLNGSKKHEEYTEEIITSKETEINKVLRKYFLKEEIKTISDIIKKDSKNKEVEEWIIQLISSQVDVDRLDYLMRDSYYSLSNYGNLDIEWIISNAKINDHKLVFTKDAIHPIESVLIARYHMYTRVYLNQKVIAFEEQLSILFAHLKSLYAKKYSFKSDISRIENILKKDSLSLTEFLLVSDDTIFEFIKELNHQETDDKLIQKLTNNIIKGLIPEIFDLSNEKIKKKFDAKIKNKQENVEYKIISLNDNFDYRNSSDDKNYSDNKEVKILMEDSILKNISEVSSLINSTSDIEPKYSEIKIGVLI